jgi:lipoate-protein ligase A
MEVERAAVVLGSTQSLDAVDGECAAALGFDVVRRRSGGGVVILRPGDHAWIDVTVPRGHALWDDDVERATHWLGEAWCAALRDAVGDGAWAVHRGKLTADATQRAVCFASVGPGEVTRDGRKVVGVSQRRTKDAARFQCTVFRAIETATYSQVLRQAPPVSLAQAVGVGGRLDALAHHTVARLTESLG